MAIFYRKTHEYDPKKDSHYMSEQMRAYFRNRLYEELQQLIEEDKSLSLALVENTHREPDFVDQSSMEELRFNCYIYQEHETSLRHEIESALKRLDKGTYGYCAATGKRIGVDRLIAAPYAMYCIHIQSEKENYPESVWG